MKKKSWSAILTAFDPVYFSSVGSLTLEQAAYKLATWFFDNEKKSSLRKMISKLPEELWMAALKNWRDENHDT